MTLFSLDFPGFLFQYTSRSLVTWPRRNHTGGENGEFGSSELSESGHVTTNKIGLDYPDRSGEFGLHNKMDPFCRADVGKKAARISAQRRLPPSGRRRYCKSGYRRPDVGKKVAGISARRRWNIGPTSVEYRGFSPKFHAGHFFNFQTYSPLITREQVDFSSGCFEPKNLVF